MKKEQAIALLGGSVVKAAEAIRIKPQAVSQWPDVLPARLIDRVQAALYRQQIEKSPASAAAAAHDGEASHD